MTANILLVRAEGPGRTAAARRWAVWVAAGLLAACEAGLVDPDSRTPDGFVSVYPQLVVPIHDLLPDPANSLLGAGLLLGGLVVLVVLWRRSVPAQARHILRRMSRVPQEEEPNFHDREIIRQYPPARVQALFEYMARHLPKSEPDPRAMAEVFRLTGRLYGLLGLPRKRSNAAPRLEIARILEQRTRVIEPRNGEMPPGSFRRLSIYRAIAARDRCYMALLRAESPSHLAALRGEFGEFLRIVESGPRSELIHLELLRDLESVMILLEPLDRLPGAEDQALLLGQALARISEMLEKLRSRLDDDPTAGLKMGEVILESIRQLIASALESVHQRARLRVELLSKVLAARREAVVVLELRNEGKGLASDIVVELEPQQRLFTVREPRQGVTSLLRDQTARLEFLLVEPRVSDRGRLSFRITYSDLDRNAHQLEFADVVHFKVVKALTFRPLHPNPYVVGRPLGRSDIFIGREKTFQLIVSSLRGVNQDNVVILIGQRRMGKTSILRRLPARLGERYLSVLVDLQGFLGSDDAAFFRELVAILHDELAEAGVAVDEPAASAFELDPATTFRRGFLREAGRALGERRLLLMFDEFEVLEERIRRGVLSPQILPWFRSLLQHERHVSFLFAGTHRLDELTSDYWSVLFNLAVYVDTGHFTQDQVDELLLRPARGVFEIDPLALEKIYLLTGGHPHFSQLLARELVDFRNSEKLSYITVQDVNLVAEHVVEKGHLHMGYLWDEASRGERLLLLALKELLAREGLASMTTAHSYLTRHQVEPGDLPAAARQLTRKEILRDNAGQLSFRMDLLRLWLEQHRNLETFLLSENRT